MAERIITTQDRENAQRLKALWNMKKKELKLTQTKAADILGFKHQSTVSQYLNCDIALNAETVLGFAKMLSIDPTQIDPTLRQFTVRPVQPAVKRVVVLCRIEFSDTGDQCMAVPPKEETTNNPFESDLPEGCTLLAIEVGTDAYRNAFNLPHNVTVYIMTNAELQVNDVVFVRQFDDKAGFYRLIGVDHNEHSYILFDPLTDTRIEIPEKNMIDFGVKVGIVERTLFDRASRRE